MNEYVQMRFLNKSTHKMTHICLALNRTKKQKTTKHLLDCHKSLRRILISETCIIIVSVQFIMKTGAVFSWSFIVRNER